jgi:hypothetical protein
MNDLRWLLIAGIAGCSSAPEDARALRVDHDEILTTPPPVCTVDSDPDTCGGTGSHPTCGDEQTNCSYACGANLTYNAARKVCVPCGGPGLLSCGGVGGTCWTGLMNVGARCMQHWTKWAPKLVIMCRYDETPDTATADANTRKLFLASSSGTDNLFDYYAEMTYGHLDLSGTQVIGWYSMGSITNATIDPTKVGRNPIYSACVAAAQAANPNLSLGSYEGVVTVINADNVDDGWGGTGVNVGRDHLDTNFVAHEVGHSYGLNHTQDLALSSCGGAAGDYCDRWDEMSAQRNYSHALPVMPDGDGTPGANGFVAAQRMLLATNLGMDLFAPSDVYVAPASATTTVSLTAVNRIDMAGTRVVKIPVDASRYYTVEVVRKSGWDIGAPDTLVLIHLFDTGNRVKSVLIDKGWAAGTTWTTTGLTIKVVSINALSASATVTITRS